MSPHTNLSNVLNVLTESRAVRHEARQPGGGRLLFAATANSQFAAKLLQGDVDYSFAVLICERFDCVFHANGSISHYLGVLSCREFCRFSFLKCVGIVAHLIRSLPGPLGTKRGDA